MTILSNDTSGDVIRKSFTSKSSDIVIQSSKHRTAQSIVVLDSKGECRFLIGDMEIHEEITPELVSVAHFFK